MVAEIPPLDPRPLLSMGDMGMAHDMSSMSGSDHSTMGHDKAAKNGAVDHAAMGHGGGAETTTAIRHASTESGPGVDMLAEQVSTGLDHPGVGLKDNGRRVLSYADLHTLGGPIDRREPGREIELHLTGHMERFMWSFNGKKFSEAEPLRFEFGERLRITLVNDSMMTHPIHLHGMWSEIENPHAQFQVRKHTVMVNPAQRISYAVTADALGRWAYHCHLLYHMEAGMFREVVVSRGAGEHE
jgi:CopA family copper-resistance protein